MKIDGLKDLVGAFWGVIDPALVGYMDQQDRVVD